MAPGTTIANFSGFNCQIDGVEYQGVLSPLSRAMRQGVDLLKALEINPTEGEQAVNSFVEETLAEIKTTTGPINYVVAGAEPEFSSPMQYGGHFLELDRKLIEGLKPSITMIGGPETYIDILSDLAETFLIWNPESNPVNPDEVEKMTRAQTVTQVFNFPTLHIGGAQ